MIDNKESEALSERASVAATRALWAECERELYPMAVSDAPGYQRALMTARAVADEMGRVAAAPVRGTELTITREGSAGPGR